MYKHTAIGLAFLCGVMGGCNPAAISLTLPKSEHTADKVEYKLSAEIVPHLEGEIRPDKNYIYCGTAKLAWEASDKSIWVRTEESIQLAKAIDRIPLSKLDLPENSYSVGDGRKGPINDQIQARFPNADIPDAAQVFPDLPVQNLVFAYMQRNLPFEVPFKVLPPLVFQTSQGKASVASFGCGEFTGGALDKVLSRQVDIIDYKSDQDFILELKTQSKEDRLVIAMLEPSSTMQATLDEVKHRYARRYGKEDERARLREGDHLQIPNVRCRRQTAWQGLKMWQMVRFELDENGAELESLVIKGVFEAGEEYKPPPPRHFIVNRAFLVYLEQTSSDNPYFVAWIANESLLEKPGQTKVNVAIPGEWAVSDEFGRGNLQIQEDGTFVFLTVDHRNGEVHERKEQGTWKLKGDQLSLDMTDAKKELGWTVEAKLVGNRLEGMRLLKPRMRELQFRARKKDHQSQTMN